jgi:hypothetical protein
MPHAPLRSPSRSICSGLVMTETRFRQAFLLLLVTAVALISHAYSQRSWARVLLSLLPTGTAPTELMIGLDARVMLFSIVISIVTGVCSGAALGADRPTVLRTTPSTDQPHPGIRRPGWRGGCSPSLADAPRTVARRVTLGPTHGGRSHDGAGPDWNRGGTHPSHSHRQARSRIGSTRVNNAAFDSSAASRTSFTSGRARIGQAS